MSRSLVTPETICADLNFASFMSQGKLHHQYDVVMDRTMYRYDPRPNLSVAFWVWEEDHKKSLNQFYQDHLVPVIQRVFDALIAPPREKHLTPQADM